MELSVDLPNLAQQFDASKRQGDSSCLDSSSVQLLFDISDIIHHTQIDFRDNETWLYNYPSNSDTDLDQWFNGSVDDFSFNEQYPKSELPKNIDTRTFTRPKKRFTRPSIEKYNEELYGSDDSSPKKLTDSGISLNGASQDNSISPKPLHFDLAQPTTSYHFESILANTSSFEPFQNMSPPSLVNSMCSSSFANLMENSFIKNDPELREIRDTDYTDSILQNETEPMFQSLTESFSSMNSDVAENFLKRVSLNDTFRRSFTKQSNDNRRAEDASNHAEATLNQSNLIDNKTISLYDKTLTDDVIASETTNQRLNGTYQRNPKMKTTFTVADVKDGAVISNNTFQKRFSADLDKSSPERALNSTMTLNSSGNGTQEDLNRTIIVQSPKRNTILTQVDKTFGNNKRLLNRRESPSMDLNRLSYCVEDKNDELNSTFVNHKPQNDVKRNSLSGSTDSENLDYMSVSSGSSRGSMKMLNMDGINAIVEMQERSLQVMSTPKLHIEPKTLWENSLISPISGRNSDPELSSSETADLTTVISSATITRQKSLGHLAVKDLRLKDPLVAANRFQSLTANIRGSQPNLKTMNINLRTSQSNLRKPSSGSNSNLKTMGRTLKGSYTNLKPISAVLPVAPPPLNATNGRTRASTAREVVIQAPQTMVRPQTVNVADVQVVRPQQAPRASGLPRPTSGATGIPRPASRIPAPRTVRSAPKPVGQQGRPTTYGHY